MVVARGGGRMCTRGNGAIDGGKKSQLAVLVIGTLQDWKGGSYIVRGQIWEHGIHLGTAWLPVRANSQR